MIAEFVTMGGYAAYVWASYGITLLVLGILPLRASLRLRQTRADLAASRGPSETEARLTVRTIE